MIKVLRALFAIALCLILGCAGGSRGSGGQLFDGSVSDASGRSLSGVTVTLPATGDSSVTDAQGNFSIETEDLQGNVEFLLEGPTFTATTQAIGIPSDAVHVQVRFQVGEGSKPTVNAEVEVKERQPTPTPKPTASHSSSLSSSSSSATGGSSSSVSQNSSGGSSSDSSGSSSSSSDDNGSSSSGGGSGGSSSSSSNGSGSTPGGNGQPTPTPTATPIGGLADGTVIDAEGTITSIGASAVVINGNTFVPTVSTEYRGKNGATATLASFSVGQKAKARGRSLGGVLKLEKLEAK